MSALRPGFEKKPTHPVDVFFRPDESAVHLVSDGEDWYSVADRYKVDAKKLIDDNFKTLIPEEINWYLGHYVRCKLPTPDRKNWCFSTAARHGGGHRPGVVYVPLDWKAILAEAKRATADFVPIWFQSASLGPRQTSVLGASLAVLPGAIGSSSRAAAPLRESFELRLRNAGAPELLAQTWARLLDDNLAVSVQGVEDFQPAAFPTLSGGAFPGPHVAIPWPVLQNSKLDGVLKPAIFQTILAVSRTQGPAAKNAMQRYGLWFEKAFATFRRETLAKDVRAMVMPSPNPISIAQGTAFGLNGFLSFVPFGG